MHSSRSDFFSPGTVLVWAYLLLRDRLLCCLACFFWKTRPQTGLCSVSYSSVDEDDESYEYAAETDRDAVSYEEEDFVDDLGDRTLIAEGIYFILLVNKFTFSSHTFYINLGHPRKTRAVETSKMIIGHTQNITADINGVCPCPICPKGNLIVNSLFLALF